MRRMRSATVRRTGRTTSRAASEQRAHLAREAVEVLLFVAIIFIIVHFTIQSFTIRDTTMSTQLKPEQFVLINTKAYLLGDPQRGDVILLADPHDTSQQHIRRVIAVPGDTISINATQTIVDGVALNEPYVQTLEGQAPNSVIVPQEKLGPNQYFVLGDSRQDSVPSDSRTFGVVPRANVLGKAVVVFWPVSAFHWIDSYSSVFSSVHGQ